MLGWKQLTFLQKLLELLMLSLMLLHLLVSHDRSLAQEALHDFLILPINACGFTLLEDIVKGTL